MAREAIRAGGAVPAVMNAANEVAVAAFLEGRTGFLDIERVVAGTMERIGALRSTDLDGIMAADAEARRVAASLL
jgi:1-deoxy-D-xylulose-5-phosphate reductoisomerase